MYCYIRWKETGDFEIYKSSSLPVNLTGLESITEEEYDYWLSVIEVIETLNFEDRAS